MLIFGEMRHDEPILRAEPERGIPLRMLFAGLLAANLLLMPALAEAARPRGKARADIRVRQLQNAAPRVSPYAIANRQRATAPKPVHLPTMHPSVGGPHKPVNRAQ